MGIDHGGAHIGMPQQLLDRADVRPTLKQMRRKTVPEHVTGHRFAFTNKFDVEETPTLGRNIEFCLPNHGFNRTLVSVAAAKPGWLRGGAG